MTGKTKHKQRSRKTYKSRAAQSVYGRPAPKPVPVGFGSMIKAALKAMTKDRESRTAPDKD